MAVTRSKPKANTVLEFIRNQQPKYRAIMRNTRRAILRAAPLLQERLWYNWPSYFRGKKFVCFIYATGDHVNLGLREGKSLKDPQGLLEGSGKTMRHIKLRKPADVDARVISRFVKQAYALAALRGS